MDGVIKAYAITDAQISFVSLVDKAANKRCFLITKAEDGKANFTSGGRIVTKDVKSHLITGIVYEPLVEDAHGNYMTEDEIRKAAAWYRENGNKVDLQHSFKSVDGLKVVESYVTAGDTFIGGEKIAKGTWMLTVECSNNDIWEQVQKGEITGFSMGGIGKYSEEDVDLGKVQKDGILKRFVRAIEKLAEPLPEEDDEQVVKAGRKMSGKNKARLDEIARLVDEFKHDFDDEDNEPNDESGTKGKSKGDDSMAMNEEMQAAIDEAVAKAVEKALAESLVESKGKQAEGTTAGNGTNESKKVGDMTADEFDAAIEKAIVKALSADEEEDDEGVAPSTEELIDALVEKKLAKWRGDKKNLGGHDDGSKSKEEHYLHGIL